MIPWFTVSSLSRIWNIDSQQKLIVFFLQICGEVFKSAIISFWSQQHQEKIGCITKGSYFVLYLCYIAKKLAAFKYHFTPMLCEDYLDSHKV